MYAIGWDSRSLKFSTEVWDMTFLVPSSSDQILCLRLLERQYVDRNVSVQIGQGVISREGVGLTSTTGAGALGVSQHIAERIQVQSTPSHLPYALRSVRLQTLVEGCLPQPPAIRATCDRTAVLLTMMGKKALGFEGCHCS